MVEGGRTAGLTSPEARCPSVGFMSGAKPKIEQNEGGPPINDVGERKSDPAASFFCSTHREKPDGSSFESNWNTNGAREALL